mmetsp:Transcript_4961/g.13936  ORF Transcript_4961/g.13936 Transcript_4961/m.13936 type:complete len:288 (+) Transcript_4961:3029-3892(+)
MRHHQAPRSSLRLAHAPKEELARLPFASEAAAHEDAANEPILGMEEGAVLVLADNVLLAVLRGGGGIGTGRGYGEFPDAVDGRVAAALQVGQDVRGLGVMGPAGGPPESVVVHGEDHRDVVGEVSAVNVGARLAEEQSQRRGDVCEAGAAAVRAPPVHQAQVAQALLGGRAAGGPNLRARHEASVQALEDTVRRHGAVVIEMVAGGDFAQGLEEEGILRDVTDGRAEQRAQVGNVGAAAAQPQGGLVARTCEDAAEESIRLKRPDRVHHPSVVFNVGAVEALRCAEL